MVDRIRVLDLTDHRGQIAAQMLNLLGADVVLVEPPGGSTVRTMAPFADYTPPPERSLPFVGWNRGKRSVVLDPTTVDGGERLMDLVRRADVLIESGAFPVDLAALRRSEEHTSELQSH